MLVCPACGSFVFVRDLNELSGQAQAATTAGDLVTAITLWRKAMTLLPPDTEQYQGVAATVTSLGQRIDAGEGKRAGGGPRRKGLLGFLATAGTVALSFLGKIKLLLLGLTKAPVFLSMLLSMGVYWTIFGWKFAVGVVLCIYVHEMGHVVALTRYGLPASAPMFIPGLGALIRLKQTPANPREDARMGLAGPEYGLYASVACMLAGFWLHADSLLAIAKVSAWINLFNLVPFSSLDGGRGFRALGTPGRLLIVALFGAAWVVSHDGLLVLLVAVGIGRTLMEYQRPVPTSIDVLWRFAALIVALGAVSMLPVKVNI
jgi:Zn-dependent protease